MTRPRRRWFAFSLRTLFAVVTLAGCWLGYQLNWIRQRRDARQRQDIAFYLEEVSEIPLPPGFQVNPTLAPWQIRILGEPGYAGLVVSSTMPEAQFKRIAALFPESKQLQAHVPIVRIP